MIQSPGIVWLRSGAAVALALAALVGWLFYRSRTAAYDVLYLDDQARDRLAAVRLVPVRTAAVEREWVATGFEPELLVAPVGRMPCVKNAELYFGPNGYDPQSRRNHLAKLVEEDPSNRFPALLLAMELVNAEYFRAAEDVIEETLKNGPDVSAGLPLFHLTVVMHLHHARGVARLSDRTFEPPWTSLKHAVSGAGFLTANRQLRRRPGEDIRRYGLIPTPNCSDVSGDDLSVDDLQNNLIVAYMRGGYRPGQAETNREMRRGNARTALQHLFAVQLRRQAGSAWPDLSQLWALSNVERSVSAGLPDDARLAVNAIQVIDWWAAPERCPPTVCGTELLAEIAALRDALLLRAVAWRNITTQQRGVFARNVTRALASSRLDAAEVRAITEVVRPWLDAREVPTLKLLDHAAFARNELPRWIVRPQENEPHLFEPLGPHAERWRNAALNDFVASAATDVEQWPVAERRPALIALRRLAHDDEIPAELEAIISHLPLAERLLVRWSASPWSWAVLSILLAVLLWLAVVWVLVQVWERRMLKTSLYNVELDQWMPDADERLKER